MDNPATVKIFRWNYKKFVRLLRSNRRAEDQINVYLLQSWGSEKIGVLDVPEDLELPYLPLESQIGEIETGIAQALTSDGKVGVVAHGPPGNGKSYFARYLARRFKLDVYIVVLVPHYTNVEIIRMFSHIEGPALVLFEDFDSSFDGRDCKIPEAKITFDALLNVLDGSYVTMHNVVYYMTANHIDRLDPALIRRPSRFRYVVEIDNPPKEVIERVLGKTFRGSLPAPGEKSLDELLTMKIDCEH
jgi:ATP-dependent 26S proteasome regulatory subunit